ncbi:homoserine O-succinyltransferase [Xanthomonas oryzae pv. oryzae]|uniref:homoserine O-succinyltransferase n=1 Tax=Xanthomonas oryzae TaxID=347 RepID=UPI000DDD57C0|nr:homoserine O-succinyltransferase [Xanthomonas oryzae]RBH86170.1 homoserine O-succinyltransferase [Xanthomonas oryzae pv. oryzae]
MSIIIPKGLPAGRALENEGITVLQDETTIHPQCRIIRVGLLNLMPNKINTEIQIARLLGSTPFQIELTLVRISSHSSKNTPIEHLKAFYQDWRDINNLNFDGFIITGAPIEKIPFRSVDYWDELTEVFRWTQTHVHSCFNICWGAHAAMHLFYGVKKHVLKEKLFGVFKHHIYDVNSPYLKGFTGEVHIPVSRWTEIRRNDLPVDSGVSVLIDSLDAGICLLSDPEHHALHFFNHIEYDSNTLADEYFRDLNAGINIQLPKGYFPNDCPHLTPTNRWRGHALLLFENWISHMHKFLNGSGQGRPLSIRHQQ